MIFGVLSLLLVLAVVAIAAKKQRHSVSALPAAAAIGTQPAKSREQSQALQQQVQQATEAASQSRAQADEK